MLKILGMMLGLLISSVPAQASDYAPSLPIDHIDTINNTIEKKVRGAAVRVTVPFTGGHGS